MTKRPIWVLEYQATDGKWYVADWLVRPLKKEMLSSLRQEQRHIPDGKFRIARYERKIP